MPPSQPIESWLVNGSPSMTMPKVATKVARSQPCNVSVAVHPLLAVGERSSYPVEDILSEVDKFDKVGETIVANLSIELAVCARHILQQQSVRSCDLCDLLALCIRLK